MKQTQYLLIFFSVLLNTSAFAMQSECDSLEKILEHAKGNERISTLNQLAPYYVNESPQKAFNAAYKALYLSSFTDNAEILSDSYFTTGTIHFMTSSLDSAKYYMNRALKTSVTNEQTAKILDNIGIIYKDLSVYDSSLLYHNQALKLQQTLGDRDAVATCCNNIGNVYMQMGKYNDALAFYQKTLTERKIQKNLKSIAAVYNNMSAAYLGMNKYSEALAHLTKASALQHEIGDSVGEAYTLNGIGNFYFRLKVYDKAQEYYTKSLELRTKTGDKNDIAASQFNIATVHRDLGNVREALKYYNQALELRTQTDNKEAQALILNAIGGTYKNLKEYGKAIENYEKALALNKLVGSKKTIASSYERLGMAYKDTCLYRKAADYYDNAIFEYRQIGDSINLGRMFNFYGNLYKEQEDYKNAMSCYNKAEQYYTGNTQGLAYVLYNKGQLGLEFPQYQQENTTETYFSNALTYARNCKEKSLIRDIFYALYLKTKKEHKNAESLSYYEQYTAIKDSIESDKNKERIAELEFESDIKILEHINEAQQMRIREEEEKQTRAKIQISILSIALLAIAVFAFLLYRQFKQKKNALKLLYDKQSEVEQAYDNVKEINATLEKKNQQIINSLTYAKRIQKAILPSNDAIQKLFPDSFVLFLPKEIVSGDFFWTMETPQYTFLAIVDCTGHGVPGAFMSMVGNTLLNQIVGEMKITSPAEILNALDKETIKILKQDESIDSQEDGMAISLIRYEKGKNEIVFAGAGQKITVVKDGELQIVNASLFSIGGLHAIKQSKNISFTESSLTVSQGTSLYLYSDGYIDQFGGEKDERFSSRRFNEMIATMQDLNMSEQFIHLSKSLDSWKGSTRQVDDILVVGIKF